MSYSHVELKNFIGLFLQQNSFSVPEGALEDALNCVITMDGVITKRRGNFVFMDPGSNTLNNLFLYQSNLLDACTDRLQRIDSSGVATDLTGVTVSITNGRVARSSQANDNLYLTSDNGILKLSAYNSTVFQAGLPPALDLRGKFAAADGPIMGDTQVGYRIVYFTKDQNKNLILSAPSDIAVLINRKIIGATYTSSGAGPYTVTVTTPSPHNLGTSQTVTITNGSNSNVNGDQIITVTSATTFTFTVVPNPAGPGTLDYTVTRETDLEFSIADGINSTQDGYQVYRSTQSASDATTPSADFKLIKEQNFTSAELTARVAFFTDNVLDIFEGEELYTNPNSREGELQANYQPPLSADLTLFKNHMLYANCTTKHSIEIDVVSTSSSFIATGNWIEIKQGATTRRYVARTGVGNNTSPSQSVSGTTTITVTYTSHGLINGDTILVSNVVGTVAEQQYVISGVTANTFDFTAGVGQSATSLDFQGVKNLAGEYIFQLVAPGSSPSTGIDSTSRAIVKAVNRDVLAVFTARYISGVTDIPGKMLFTSETFTSSPIQLRAENTTVGGAFNPELPASFGTTVQSTQDVLPNNIFSSKVGEPEAVPLVNNFPIGSRNKAILRVFSLRDSVIILKEDGVFRMDGDETTNFTSTILDGTVVCVSANSAALINNQVVFLSNQGVCLVTSTSVQIISRKIESPIAAVLGKPDLLANTSAVSYESERLYLLTTILPNTTTASVVYCYNTLTDAWTTWDQYFKQGVVGPNDILYLISTNNRLLKERKNQNKLDYTAQDYAATNVSMASDKLSGIFTVSAVNPQPGDVLFYANLISRIATVTPSGSNFLITFESISNIITGASVRLYQRFKSSIKLAPFHAGQTNREKQFAQMQIHTKEASISTLDISYSNDTFGSSELTTWKQNTVALQGGWGQLPWGFFAWGLDQGINLTYSTQPAPIVRTYIPLFAQRSTFIQPILEHNAGAEPLNIQAIGFQVRGYNERVSR